MDADGLALTNRLLKVLIAILMKGGERQLPLKQQIEMLDSLGLKPKEIAEILGKTNTHVSKELTGIRKKAR